MNTEITFKIGPAREDGRSEVGLELNKYKLVAENTDKILYTLDKIFKKNKIKLEDVESIKLEVDKKAGITSQRVVKAIIKALRFSLKHCPVK